MDALRLSSITLEGTVHFKYFLLQLFIHQAVARLIRKGGMRVVNVDATVVLEEPKLTPYVDSMRRRIARSLGIKPTFVSVKATTNEGLGCAGHREGCAAFAVALIANTGSNKG